MTIPETMPFRVDSGSVGAWPIGRLWVRAQSIFQPSDWARRQPSSRAFSAVGRGDVDLDPQDLEIGGAVHRRDAAIGALQLRVEHAGANQEERGDERDREGKRSAERASRGSFGELAVEIQAGVASA